MGFYTIFRNIARNKKNSALIIFLITIIIFLFFIGNSVISRSNMSVRHAFINSLTGDVVLQAKTDVTMNLFGANTPVIDTFFTIPVLPAFDIVIEMIKQEEGIAGITSQVSGKAFLDIYNVREPVLLCGADMDTYFSMFPGIILEEGRYLSSGESGAMITMERALRIENQSGIFPKIGDPLLFTSGGELGFRIREVPLTGIFSYKNPGQFMNEIIIIDPQIVREFNSIQVATSSHITELSEDAIMFLDMDINDIFGEEILFNANESTEDFSADFLTAFLSETRDEENVELVGGDWNFIILRLNENISHRSFISSINKKLDPYRIVAVDWRVAAGTSAILLLMIQALFNAGIFLVCVAGVITVINILLISVFRRTREIGTMRAIGASDIYICSLILRENLILTLFSGIIGILGGFLFILLINSFDFYIQNNLIASLLGGHILSLEFIPQIAFLSFILAILLGIIVSIYPIYITIRIEPIEAVRQG